MSGTLFLADTLIFPVVFLRLGLRAERHRDGALYIACGADYLAVWMIVLAARVALVYGTEHWLARCTVRIALAVLRLPSALPAPAVGTLGRGK
jgi:hypothetical protein